MEPDEIVIMAIFDSKMVISYGSAYWYFMVQAPNIPPPATIKPFFLFNEDHSLSWWLLNPVSFTPVLSFLDQCWPPMFSLVAGVWVLLGWGWAQNHLLLNQKAM